MRIFFEIERLNATRISFTVSPANCDPEEDNEEVFLLDITDQKYANIEKVEKVIGMLQDLVVKGKESEKHYYISMQSNMRDKIQSLRRQADDLENMLNEKLDLKVQHEETVLEYREERG